MHQFFRKWEFSNSGTENNKNLLKMHHKLKFASAKNKNSLLKVPKILQKKKLKTFKKRASDAKY